MSGLDIALVPAKLPPTMKSSGVLKHILLAFLFAAIFYALTFRAIEHRRTRKGPWRVDFTNTAAGLPALVINQPALAISNIEIRFAGQALESSNRPAMLVFSQPQPVPYALPFGKCIFMDTTFLPGTIVMQLYGHEVELLPRVLIIDGQERAWRSGSTTTLYSPRTNQSVH